MEQMEQMEFENEDCRQQQDAKENKSNVDDVDLKMESSIEATTASSEEIVPPPGMLEEFVGFDHAWRVWNDV